MQEIKLGILGPTGRMGNSLLKESKLFPEIKITSLCENKGHESIGKSIYGVEVKDDLNEFIDNSDVIIDFTTPKATLRLLEYIRKNKKTFLITGTTGYSKVQELEFKRLSKDLTILRSSNMSIGINLLLNFVELLSLKLGKDVDIEILETHHKHKKDAPSGTALSIGNSILKGRKGIEKNKFIYRGLNFNKSRSTGDIGFSSIRGGDVVGEHTAYFIMDGERLEITHRASKREIFSRGALKSVFWLILQKQGLYDMQDMFK